MHVKKAEMFYILELLCLNIHISGIVIHHSFLLFIKTQVVVVACDQGPDHYTHKLHEPYRHEKLHLDWYTKPYDYIDAFFFMY